MSRLHARITRELGELEARSRRRRLASPSGIDFSSNDYLALSDDPGVLRAVAEAAARGVPHGSTGSRLLSGNHPLHVEAERRFARFLGREDALLFSSGFAANHALLSALPSRRDLILLDAAAHASLKEGARASLATKRSFPHNDPDGLRRALRDRPAFDAALVVIEGIYSMDGDAAPIAELAEVAREHDAELVVDEAHATGLYGHQARGIHATVELPRPPLATVHPCGKALGSAGAFVAADRSVIDYLVNVARPFLFSTAPAPLQAAALLAALDLLPAMAGRAEAVLDLSARLRRRLDALRRWRALPGSSPIVPVVIGADDRALAAAEMLRKEGLDVRAIRPPTVPAGTARLRISLTARHAAGEIDRLADAVLEAERILEGTA